MGCSGRKNHTDAKETAETQTIVESQESAETKESEEAEEIAPVEGVWAINSKLEPSENINAMAAFDKALDGLTGAEYEPITYIGYKDNSYAVLTKITITSAEPLISLSTVYITKTDSGAMIDDIYDIDMSLENVGNQ